MKEALHILIVEDISSDAELAERELKKVLKNYIFKVVETKKTYIQALKTFQPDLIISDYLLPDFDGLSALNIQQVKCPFVPFIILTGSVNEQTAVKCMKAGADDYVIKEHIKRLGSAVLSVIEKKKNENELRLQEKDLLLFRELIDNSTDSIFVINPDNSKFIDVNLQAISFLGYSREELLNIGVIDIDTAMSDSDSWNYVVENIHTEGKLLLKSFHKHKNGTLQPVEVSAKIVIFEEKEYIIAIVRDITDRLKAENKLLKTSNELEQTHIHTIYMLALASEYKDPETGNHIQRIQKLTIELALELSFEQKMAKKMGNDSVLHDLGKLGISDYILLKPDKLTDNEFEIMKQHTVIGAKIIGDDKWFTQARQIALHHHEKWDGSGYPEGLKGEDIPIAARIVAIVDEFDALVAKRSYKESWSIEKAIEEIERESGTHFDPQIVKAFLSLYKKGKL